MEEEEMAAAAAAAAGASSSGGVAAGGGGGDGGGDAEKKKPAEGEGKSKRKMKTASQLEILEKTYAVEPYPSEAIRTELSGQLGLSDRQLQMWFCHRRLKDRKGPSKRQRKDSPAAAAASEPMLAGVDAANELPYGAVAGSSSFVPAVDAWRTAPRVGTAVARITGDYPVMKRHYEPEPSVAESHAIAFVEAQLGEPLREDGPILGMEFDPLPPGAFGTPIGGAVMGQHKQTGRSFEAKYERSDAKSIKGVVRPVHEYQFLPEKPTVRAETYERVVPAYHYGSDSMNPRISGGPSLLPVNEAMPSGYGLQSRMPILSLLTPPGKQGHLLASTSGEYDLDPSKTSSANLEIEKSLGAHSGSALDNSLVSSDRRVIHNEELLRAERKRKSEEARIQREVEAHEKRIRKELKKQDILRRKREEQVRKEMERLDRERRREEERLLREKQREIERYQREQRRELERREKFLQKESRRAEKMRRKEQVRREKEAARLKAASERAIARRMAKESVELIEDEQLELMELAASSKELPSIMSLDFETLQNLELLRDSMTAFPAKSVQMKKPFAIQPWSHSEENIGNLLMVWRFLITFADVLGLWPFTLDEFVQAFHDYDARLLGEIHVSLLRTIIKDIEDVARTPSTNVGANLNSVANPGGGHPHIVEGAYSWGFDIRAWQRQLNPLTWPEILRQFVLSAGFGPQLKKKNVDAAYVHDDHEGQGDDGRDIISFLRNGAAAEHAFAKMQQRGYSNLRRSRHRLTPGTVKFAAFHVLSLEGDDGLTILEVADRIQKCGLRDLTTSKTPEASVAAALSRDTKLFERTAPSTYCVRPAYRKDPADGEAILSAARERIREFKSEFVDGEEADDAERDEDSESESTEDHEVEDLNAELNSQKEVSQRDVNLLEVKTLTGNGKDDADVIDITQNGLETANEESSLMRPEDLIKDGDDSASVDRDGGGIQNEATDNQQDTDIDESNPGEPWVQGLMEGEYSDLSVEERLDALVAIIGVAIEGNSIRNVLEERLEAATALKKQMWAEAQLDKRRTKDDYLLKIHYPFQVASKTEPNLTNVSSAEGKLSPLLAVDSGNNETPLDPAIQRESMIDQQNPSPFINSEGNLQMPDIPGGSENFSLQQVGYAAEMSRSQLKSYIGYKAEELYVYRSLPLGQDRRRNRYWQFIASNSRNDPGCGRIFVELHDGRWRIIDSEEGFNSLLASLDVRGIRESYLHFMLQRMESSFKESVRRNAICIGEKRLSEDKVKRQAFELAHGSDSCIGIDSPSSSVCGVDLETSEASTSFEIELGRNRHEKDGALKRYQEFENWIWKECLNPLVLCARKYGKERCVPLINACDRCHEIYFMEHDNCPSCYWNSTTSKSDLYFSESTPPSERKLPDPTKYGSVSAPVRIRLLKVLMALMEAFVPPEALESIWTDNYRKSWGIKLQTSSSASDLLQALTLLESAIRRDHLSANFETTNELLSISSGFAADVSASLEALNILPWIPQTTAAVALRLMEFDSAISYSLHQKAESAVNNGSGDFEKLPSRYMGTRSWQNHDSAATPFRGGPLDENWADPGLIPGGSGRRRGRGTGRGLSRTSGRRSQRRVLSSSKFDSGKRARVANGERGRSRGRGGRKRGRRSTRNRQRAVKKEVPVFGEIDIPKEQMMEESPEVLIEDGWNGDEGNNAGLNLEEAENSSSSESSEYEDEDGQATGSYRYDLAVDEYSGGLNGKADELSEASDDNVDGNEEVEEDDDDDEDEGDDVVDDGVGDLDVREYINGEFDEEEEDARAIDGFENVDPDEGTASTSSEYSD